MNHQEYKVTRLGEREIATTGTEVPTPGGEGWELVGVCASAGWVFWTWTRTWTRSCPVGKVEPTDTPPRGTRGRP
jgi:hypothetical protein